MDTLTPNMSFELTEYNQKQTDSILNIYNNVTLDGNEQPIYSLKNLSFPASNQLSSNEYRFFKVEQLSFDEDYPRREAMENVLLSVDDEAFNFVYVLTGTTKGVELCLGIVKNGNEQNPLLETKLSASNHCENIAKAFEGNFNGSKLKKLCGDESKQMAILSTNRYKYAGAVRGVPSVDEKDADSAAGFQGIDRLINSMLGQEWRLVIICEPVQKEHIMQLKSNVYDFYNNMSMWAKSNIQRSQNFGETETTGSNYSSSHNYSQGTSTNKGGSSSKAHSSSSSDSSNSNTKGKSWSSSSSENTSDGTTWSTNSSTSKNKGSSASVSVEMANKAVQEMMHYIDDELLKRLKLGVSKRMFKTSILYMADNPTSANRLKVGLMSLFQGSDPSYSPLHASPIDLSDHNNRNTLSVYQNRSVYKPDENPSIMAMLSRPYDGEYEGVSTYLTAKEVSLLAGLPQKEVPGITLKKSIPFGLNTNRNINEKANEKAIELGFLMQKGRELTTLPFALNASVLNKHIFVAGVTGSGKTTTCHRLLHEIANNVDRKKIPFMVIEPAKTEYRALVRYQQDFGNVTVFTVGKEPVAPFRLNPFELVHGELISSHVDMLKAAFTSAFPMEASMPQILEEAIYQCYEAMGWDIDSSEYLLLEENGDPFKDNEVDAFPQLSDLLQAMKDVVETKGFGSELKQNYVGSLVSRLSNLTVGSKGLMLNCPRSIDFHYLANNNVIIELEEIKSGEEKSFIIGLLLSRMAATVKLEYQRNKNYRHVTLLEEAHRLLSRVEYGDSGSKKNAVETFADMLAEIRKYGEGLIIVDQIPNKLTSEVLKNTNTKIIHRILARDDKDAVGNTMLMDDKQKEYLSALGVGEAIVFTEITDNPVNIKINPFTDTSEEQVTDEEVAQNFQSMRTKFDYCFGDRSLTRFFKPYQELRQAIYNMTAPKSDDDKERTKKQNQLDIIKRYHRRIAEQLQENTPAIWKKIMVRSNIIHGIRQRQMLADAQEYARRLDVMANFMAMEFTNDLTVDQLIEFKNNTGLTALK